MTTENDRVTSLLHEKIDHLRAIYKTKCKKLELKDRLSNRNNRDLVLNFYRFVMSETNIGLFGQIFQ